MFSPADREVAITAPSSSSSTSRASMTRRSSSTSISTGTSARDAISSKGVIGGLPDQVYSVLTELIDRRHHLRVRLIRALVDDQVRELGGDVDGGRLDGRSYDLPASARPRQSDHRRGGIRADAEIVVALRGESIGVANRSHRKLPHHGLLVVGELGNDLAAIGQTYFHQLRGCTAILGAGGNPRWLRDLRQSGSRVAVEQLPCETQRRGAAVQGLQGEAYRRWGGCRVELSGLGEGQVAAGSRCSRRVGHVDVAVGHIEVVVPRVVPGLREIRRHYMGASQLVVDRDRIGKVRRTGHRGGRVQVEVEREVLRGDGRLHRADWY